MIPRSKNERWLRHSRRLLFAWPRKAVLFFAAAAASVGLHQTIFNQNGPIVFLSPKGQQGQFSSWRRNTARRRLARGVGTELSLLTTGTYRALTRIRLREEAATTSKPTGRSVEPGEVFQVEEVVPRTSADGVSYLKVLGGRGWVFDLGIAGPWAGKPIVELLPHRGMVRVIMSDGTSFKIGWDNGETVLDLKKAILETFEIPIESQELLKDEEPLGRDDTLLENCVAATGPYLPEIWLFDEEAAMAEIERQARELMGDRQWEKYVNERGYQRGFRNQNRASDRRGPSASKSEKYGESLYDVLGVQQSASYKSIKAAYRNAVRTWHPDFAKTEAEKDEFREKFDAAAFAYRVLSDPKRREVYRNEGLRGLADLEAFERRRS